MSRHISGLHLCTARQLVFGDCLRDGTIASLTDDEVDRWLREIAKDEPERLRRALEERLVERVARRVKDVLAEESDY